MTVNEATLNIAAIVTYLVRMVFNNCYCRHSQYSCNSYLSGTHGVQ